jgi:hypothetical protein
VKIKDLYEEMNDRELATQLDFTEEEVKQKRIDRGLLRLENFSEKESAPTRSKMKFELDKMEKRKLQGFMGEKLAELMKSKVVDYLRKHTGGKWELRSKARMVRKGRTSHSYWAGGRPDRDEIVVESGVVKHQGAEKDELREAVRDKCVVAEDDIFEKFQEVRNPWIDFSFYALSIEETVEQTFSARDFSKRSFDQESEIDVEVPLASDFKLMAVEVKTTNSSAENLLSTNQRNVRDLAEESPYIDFFTLKVETDFSELGIPENFDAEIARAPKRSN